MGRSSVCGLRLAHPRASAEHAVVRYLGTHWAVRDLASRNGTFVAGERVPPGEEVALRLGDELRFGAPEESWTLEDDGPPEPTARAAGGQAIVGEDGLLALPSSSAPRVTIFSGPGRGWILEDERGERPVRDNEVVEVGGESYVLWLPSAGDGEVASTVRTEPTEASLRALGLRFRVSRDEEYVSMSLLGPGGEKELTPRAFHYTLLTLARLRLAEASLPRSERGWIHVESLARMLGVDPEKVNLDVYRARQQLANAGVVDAARVIERRRGTGQLRIGVERLLLEAFER